MKLILFLLFTTAIYASNATLSALGQPSEGSFYLMDNLNSFTNPGGIKYNKEQLSVQSNSFGMYKSDSFQIGLGREFLDASLIDVGFMAFDNYGFNFFANPLEGEGASVYGGTFGLKEDSFGFKMTLAHSDALEGMYMKLGMAVPIFYDMIFHASFKNVLCEEDDDKLSLALAKIFNYKSVDLFADLTYTVLHGQDKAVLTAGAYKEISLFSVPTNLIASVNKDLFFTEGMKVNVGSSFAFGDLNLDLSHSFGAFGMADPKYADFNFQAALTYYL